MWTVSVFMACKLNRHVNEFHSLGVRSVMLQMYL